MSDEEELIHEGVLRKSGRYPWGSGSNPIQGYREFNDHVAHLKRQGLTEPQIAEGMGISTTELRARKSISKTAVKNAQISEAMTLKAGGDSNVAIGKKMGLNESSVRALLDPSLQKKNDVLESTANVLKENIDRKGFLDVGVGTEHHMGVTDQKLRTAVAMLKEEGYEVYYVKTPQLGTSNFTTVKVLAPPGTKYSEVFNNQSKIKTITDYSEDGGLKYKVIETPTSVSSRRIAVRYKEEGGASKDGVIELRRGVDDISMGAARYAQVRIAVDKTHFLKGMAVYADDLPDGIDIRFNTNKSSTGNKKDAMKELKDDPDSPFGSIVRQKHYTDSSGKSKLSALNIVGTELHANEEGQWDTWSSTLSSQFLSKQSPSLAKEQLGLTLHQKKAEFDEIMTLTNPSVRKKLLESFADDADSSSVHLKAAGLPRTKSKVILPINTLKDTEIYAPTFRDGEKVVLVRHPHGGIFEIPELTVNNRNQEAKRIMKNAVDAVGINHKVAQRLSGADFDGDTVLVIPNNSRKVKNAPALQGLKDFDPQEQYPYYPGMKIMSARTKQLKMGDVSNLITDMTIRKASHTDLAAAVRHSMVVIDAEKHKLDWQRSAKENDIAGLKTKYQKGPRSGASTLISQASSEVRINDRKPRTAAKGGPIDLKTGKKQFEETGDQFVSKKSGETVVKKVKVAKIALTDDANTLSSGTPMEKVYASHANALKAMANTARLTAAKTETIPYSPSAKEVYDSQVKSLDAKLRLAQRNAPLERQAQLVANATVRAKREASPDMDPADLKKVKSLALEEARNRTGAKKTQVKITPDEWEAIQAGAISKSKLDAILNNTDLDQVKQLATPRQAPVMDSAKLARAQSMLKAGYTQSEVADALGVPTSTLNTSIA